MKRAFVALAVLLLALPLALVAAAPWFLNGDALKARLVEQVRRTTGRELTIAGPVRLAWSLTPTLVLTDVSLSNPPGNAPPQMAHVARVEAAVAIPPLFQRRLVIERLALEAPSVRLEQGNWNFRPPQAPAAAPSAPSQPASRFTIAIGAVDVTDATIAWATGPSPRRASATTRAPAPSTAAWPRSAAASPWPAGPDRSATRRFRSISA